MSSSSSSDSDSDDLEPIRRIKINIKPREEAKKSDGVDIDAIKASVGAWRPLGPRPHHSLTRRQSSLSSVSSLSFGTSSNYGGSSSTTATSFSTAANNLTASNCNNVGQSEISGFIGGTSGPNAVAGYSRGNNITGNPNFMRSSPSCSSLVNEFNSRTSFSNFMSTTSRTSSPLTFMNSNFGDAVPIALAIQESIELTVKGQEGPNLEDTKFETRALGNIKVAFPNTFARLCSNGIRPNNKLKVRLHSTENILRYYASGLIRDMGTDDSDPADPTDGHTNNVNDNPLVNSHEGGLGCKNAEDLFDLSELPNRKLGKTKTIEFDMEALTSKLKRMYDQMPTARYYNLDVLRYQIAPIDKFEKCPIQVCAYWSVEPRMIKLRIDFKHSHESGLHLERLREILFSVNLSNYVSSGSNVSPVPPNMASVSSNNNNNTVTFMNLSALNSRNAASSPMTSGLVGQTAYERLTGEDGNYQYEKLINLSDTSDSQVAQLNSITARPQGTMTKSQHLKGNMDSSLIQLRLPPPPSKAQLKSGTSTLTRSTNVSNPIKSLYTYGVHNNSQPNQNNQTVSGSSAYDLLSLNQAAKISQDGGAVDSQAVQQDAMASQPLKVTSWGTHRRPNPGVSIGSNTSSQGPQPSAPAISAPYITYEPPAHWDQKSRQLTWKFDNLLSYVKFDGYGSLLAKLDFRDCPPSQENLIGDLRGSKPLPVDVKFMVVDSTISKISVNLECAGYKMSLLKREIRSGSYKSEPYIF